MPRPRPLAHFPAKYWEIIEKIGAGGSKITIKCQSTMHALKLRGHFYAFVGSLRRQAQLQGIKGQVKDQRIQDCSDLSNSILARTEGEFLIFQHRETSWQALALENMTVDSDKGLPSVETEIHQGQRHLVVLGLVMKDGRPMTLEEFDALEPTGDGKSE